MKKILSSVLLVFLCPFAAFSQSADSIPQQKPTEKGPSITIDANMLARGEYRYGGMPVAEVVDNHAAFVMDRIRLSAELSWGNLSMRVTPQHAGIWGQSNGGSFNLNEGWMQYTTKPGLFFKIGRQALRYDDERIIGSDDWSMMSVTHDVLKLGYDGKNHHAHAIVGFNQNGEKINGGTFYKNGYQPYKSMQTLWYHYDFSHFPLGISAVFINTGMQDGDDEDDEYETMNQQLFGGYVKFHPKNFSLEASYYRQMGKSEYGLDISAYMASVKTSYTLISSLTLTAGYDYLSGDERFAVPKPGQIGLTQHKTIRGFSSIFGSHHQFYGAMDFFYMQTYVGGFTPGLQNLYFGADYKPLNNLSLTGNYHYFATAYKLPNFDRTLGHELEFSTSWQFDKYVAFQAGYTFMSGSETMERLHRTSDKRHLHWLWAQLIFTPKIFQK